jgi:2-succinyl-5-enolpyruvyl-6-hydroxy-3-cyclohexene-1-carboxylate synthase
MRYQPVYDIAEICVRKNVRQVVLCPGSRCAPLTLAFTRHPDITTKTFSDERSGGFVALGMAQASGSPVVIVCTSGTAVYNLAPAVAEAYFSQTPLIILTADRPSEWIGQHDGQTIYQTGIFGRHVKSSYQLPQDYDHNDNVWAINRIINEALNLSVQFPGGPVHINAPFREPLYPPLPESTISFTKDVRVVKEHVPSYALSAQEKEKIRRDWPGVHNILVVGGQYPAQAIPLHAIEAFGRTHHVPVVHDVISNLHEIENSIRHSDLFLGQASDTLKASLQPDLLITYGNSLISKNLKIFLRRYPAKKHWHIQPAGAVADTFKSLTDVFNITPEAFFDFLNSLEASHSFETQKQKNYLKLWEVEEGRTVRILDEFFKDDDLHELGLVRTLLNNLPEDCNLHLANSMSVRYANFIGLAAPKKGIEVLSNRGTSGIDGCTSTAVGHALHSRKPNFLITGDLAFFYDRNAFWHNYPLPNLRVLLLNNHGGLIFDVLEGPSSMPEAGEYFITRQALDARKLCEEFGFELLRIDHKRKAKNLFKEFLTFDDHTKVMELESDTALNKKVLETLKTKIKNSYDF